jgi:predicted ATPase/class 3 adenylate cyclase
MGKNRSGACTDGASSGLGVESPTDAGGPCSLRQQALNPSEPKGITRGHDSPHNPGGQSGFGRRPRAPMLVFNAMIVADSATSRQHQDAAASAAVTFLFSDIEGSTRLWEQMPDKMRSALEIHDSIAQSCIERHRGTLVKKTGDGVHAAFADPLDALNAMLDMQLQLAAAGEAAGFALALRCGLHLGADERRDGDFYGQHVNRAARVMSVAHGGQMLLSEAVQTQVQTRLPQGVSLRDLGLCRLRDLSAPLRLFQLEHPQLRADFPALRSLEATPNNLAQQLNSFVGRERELTEVRAQLDAARLVTLLGTGGIGKSRLSVQLGAELMDDFPDGVWFVELAPLTDPRLVAQAVASVLSVKEEAGHPVIDALVKHVRDRRMLIILDNCEHVVHAAADVAKKLLQAGPQLKILTSSREVLRVAGEVAYQVPALSSPEKGRAIVLDELTRHEAVRLFIDRATAAQPKFRINDKNAEAVTEICQRVDGIPLAIELAAARARALPVEKIAERLRDRFKILATTDQTVLPRQRTLQALIDWSYDYLSEKEQALFRRLSVFAGGWTLEAAEAVCAGNGIDADDVLDLLTALVEKSLVAMDAEGGRYRMLETVREYAQEKIEQDDDAAKTRARHLDFYLSFSEQARPYLVGPHQAVWLGYIDLELENILAAHDWANKTPSRRQIKSQLVRGLRMYFFSRGFLNLGLRLYSALLEDAGINEQDGERCRVLFGAGQFSFYTGDYARARQYLEESLNVARTIGDERAAAAVLVPLGLACSGELDFAAANQHLGAAVELARQSNDKREISATLTALAMLHRAQGRLDVAEPACEEALALARECGDHELVGRYLLNLAMVSISQTQLDRARALLLEAVTIAEQIGSKTVAQSAFDVCAGLCSVIGSWTQAARLFAIAEAHRVTLGVKRDPADDSFLAPLIENIKSALTPHDLVAIEANHRNTPVGEALAFAKDWLDAQTPVRDVTYPHR